MPLYCWRMALSGQKPRSGDDGLGDGSASASAWFCPLMTVLVLGLLHNRLVRLLTAARALLHKVDGLVEVVGEASAM